MPVHKPGNLLLLFKSREFPFLFALFAAAFLLRLRFVVGVAHPPLAGDAYNYDIMTRQFLEKGFLGYMSEKPNAYITPGYPIFLSAIYFISGYGGESPLFEVRVVQSFLGALTCVVLYYICRETVRCGEAAGRTTGCLAAAAYAIYPTFAWSPSLVLTETLFNFLFLSYVYLLFRVLKNGSSLLAFVCGLAFGAAVMVRPAVFPVVIIPLAYGIIRKDRRALRTALYAGIGALVVMAPWWVRNTVTLNRVILFATQAGNPFIAGVFPYFRDIDYASYGAPDQLAEGVRVVLKGFLKKPFLYLKWFTIGKFNYIFVPMWFHPPAGAEFLGSFALLHHAVVAFGWAGAAFSLAKGRLRVIAVFAILLTMVQLAFIPEPRYAYHIIPFLMILMAEMLRRVFTGA